MLPNDSDELLEKTFDVPESVDAPIAMGDKVGTVTLTLNGALVGTVDLIAGQDVARNGFCMRCHACRHSSAGFISVWYVS